MDISSWPLGRIMMLPDYLFGRRWVMTNVSAGTAVAPSFKKNRCMLPEYAVLWEICIISDNIVGGHGMIGIRLGDQVPANLAEFERLEEIFPCCDCESNGKSRFNPMQGSAIHLTRLKMAFHTMGRTVVTMHRAGPGLSLETSVSMVWSSLPKEIPDCLLTNWEKNL